MYVFLAAEETTVSFHLQTEMEVQVFCLGSCGFVILAVDSELRVVGVLDPTTCIFAV